MFKQNLHIARNISKLFLSTKRNFHLPVTCSEEVSNALASNKPLVALETTIITHGMKFPENVQCALAVEDIVRKNGAVPATICVQKGVIKAGLTIQELEELANNKDVIKISRRDYPVALGQKLTGGTTVSGTLMVAANLGISVFVTGGIGGVHRGGENSMDVSADLQELARSPVLTVCAGVKSILDIQRTLEHLETLGVGVATFGSSKKLPAFFTRYSGHQAPYNLSTIKECCSVLNAIRKLSSSGFILAVPIPFEDEASGKTIEKCIQQILQEVKYVQTTGKDITPYILDRVNQITNGESLKANIALIKNNADIGSKIAVQYITDYCNSSSNNNNTNNSNNTNTNPEVVVIGGSNIDFTCQISADKDQLLEASYPGKINVSCGGVGRNIAECLSRLDYSPLFLSALGDDHFAQMHKQSCPMINWEHVQVVPNQVSAVYVANMKHNGELIFGIGDMDIHSLISPDYLQKQEAEGRFSNAKIIVCDGNIPVETIAVAKEIAIKNNSKFWYEPTDLFKATKFVDTNTSTPTPIDFMSPNLEEFIQVDELFTKRKSFIFNDNNVLNNLLINCRKMHSLVNTFVITLGNKGILVVPHNESAFHVTALNCDNIVSVSGAGDSFAAAFIGSLLNHKILPSCATDGILCAYTSLLSVNAINPDVKSLYQELKETKADSELHLTVRYLD